MSRNAGEKALDNRKKSFRSAKAGESAAAKMRARAESSWLARRASGGKEESIKGSENHPNKEKANRGFRILL